jgi:hypothetical protein
MLILSLMTPPTNTPWAITADSLIQGTYKAGTNTTESNAGASQMLEHRFIIAKYKVYIFVMLCIILGIYSYVSWAVHGTIALYDSIQTSQATLSTMKAKVALYTQEKKLIDMIHANKTWLALCINTQAGCNVFPTLTKTLSGWAITVQEQIKTYIQLGGLRKDKMTIDEPKVIKNINEFLGQKDVFSPTKWYNGIIESIQIGNLTTDKDNIWHAPVTLAMTFERKEDILTFLGNVEKYIFTDPEKWLDYSILFVVQNIDYDIINYKESQKVSITLDAYSYN